MNAKVGGAVVTPDARLAPLAALDRALGRESHNLLTHPEILWQQLANVLQHDATFPADALAREVLRRGSGTGPPWIKTLGGRDQSDALRRTLVGHTDAIKALAFRTDGLRLLTASQNETSEWNPQTGAQTMTFPRGCDRVGYSAEGRWVIQRALGGHVVVSDATTGAGVLEVHTKRVRVLRARSLVIEPAGDAVHVSKLRLAQTPTLIARLNGHDGRVHACAYSPDEQRVVSASEDGTLIIWSGSDLQTATTLVGHTGPVHCCAFDGQGTRIVSSGEDLTVKVWDVESGEATLTIPALPQGACGCAFTDDGAEIAVLFEYGDLRVWSIATGTETARVSSLALASAGRIQARSRDASVVIGCWNDSMTLEARDRTSGKRIAAPPRFDAQPSASALGPDERLVGTTYSDGSLAVWDTGSGAVIHRFEVRGNTTQACSISPDGTRLIAGGKDHLVRLWDVAAGKKEATLAGHSGGVTCCEFSPDARVIASGARDKTINIWDVQKARDASRVATHRGSVRSTDDSPDGTLLVSVDNDGTARVWDASSGMPLRTFSGHTSEIRACAFSPAGDVIASAGEDKIRVWSATTGQQISEFEGRGSLKRSSFSPDGRFLVAPVKEETSIVNVWDVGTSEIVKTLNCGRVKECRFSLDGLEVMTVDKDDSGYSRDTISVYSVAAGKRLTRMKGHGNSIVALACRPDGRAMVTASDDHTLILWDQKRGTQKATLVGHDKWGITCRFSPDGSLVLSTSHDGTLRLWDGDTGEHIRTLWGHGAEVRDAAFSADGNYIFSVGSDDSLRLWDSASGIEIARLPIAGNPGSLVSHPWLPRLACGTGAGAIRICEIEGAVFGAPVIVPSVCDAGLEALCPACQRSRVIVASDIGANSPCPNPECGLVGAVSSTVLNRGARTGHLRWFR